MEYPDIRKKKGPEFTVSHSPGSEQRSRIYKGTPEVEEGIMLALERVEFVYDYISGVTTDQCLERKAKSHIFIDQIFSLIGMGKNGMEGIALDCITMSSWTLFQPNDFYPPHPVLEIQNAKQVQNHIVSLIKNEKKYERLLKKTKKWKKYIGYKNTINYIASVIGDQFKW